MTEGSRAPLMVLGTAIAMTAAGSADAALVSTAGTGFTPQTFTVGTVSSYSFDLDQNGSQDFTIAATATGLTLTLQAASAAATTFNTAYAFSTAANLRLSDVKHAGSTFTISGSGAAPSNYLALATNFVPTTPNDSFSSGTGTLGYLQGTYTAGTVGATAVPASFRLEDFGLVTTAASDAPEPASWVMMIAGFGGIGALRRRARATAARAAC